MLIRKLITVALSKKNLKIGVLTSSRADYGIYKQLLLELKQSKEFDLEIIAFGMHLDQTHGYTIDEIKINFSKIHTIPGMTESDSILDISNSYGKLIINFSNFFQKNKYDFIFAIGDRFEMSAAVQAGIQFKINFVHFHAGETSLVALDNIYRHQISLASNIYFVSNKEAKKRLTQILNHENNIFNVGSISLNNLDSLKLPNWKNVCELYDIPSCPFVLVTFHPETVLNSEIELHNIKIIQSSLIKISKKIHIVITLPNADKLSSNYRECFFQLKEKYPNSFSLIKSFGKENYFSAMKNCKFLLGNSSSGIIEAASFNKFVINVGNRQKGRCRSKNVIDVEFNEKIIVNQSMELIASKSFKGKNKYFSKNSVKKVKNVLLNYTN